MQEASAGVSPCFCLWSIGSRIVVTEFIQLPSECRQTRPLTGNLHFRAAMLRRGNPVISKLELMVAKDSEI